MINAIHQLVRDLFLDVLVVSLIALSPCLNFRSELFSPFADKEELFSVCGWGLEEGGLSLELDPFDVYVVLYAPGFMIEVEGSG